LYVAPGAVFEPDRQRTLTELDAADGRHTIIGAWAERAVPWTKPEDIPVSLDQPIPMPGNVMEREPFPIARFIFQMYQKKPFARTVLMRIEDVHNWWFVGPDRLEWLRPRITWNGGEKVEEY
jgi:hypothetical protein